MIRLSFLTIPALMLTPLCVAQTNMGDILRHGQVLKQGDYLQSTDSYACWLGLEGQGKIVFLTEKYPTRKDIIDATDTNLVDRYPFTMEVSSAGYIVVKDKAGQQVWQSNPNFGENINEHYLKISDGKAILYQGTPQRPGRAIWQMYSNTRNGRGGDVIKYSWEVIVRQPDGTVRQRIITDEKFATAAEAARGSEAKQALRSVHGGGYLNAYAVAGSPR